MKRTHTGLLTLSGCYKEIHKFVAPETVTSQQVRVTLLSPIGASRELIHAESKTPPSSNPTVDVATELRFLMGDTGGLNEAHGCYRIRSITAAPSPGMKSSKLWFTAISKST